MNLKDIGLLELVFAALVCVVCSNESVVQRFSVFLGEPQYLRANSSDWRLHDSVISIRGWLYWMKRRAS